MTVVDAYESRRHGDVYEETWGHLAPDVGTHKAEIVFALGYYNDMIVIDATVGDLPDSPWLYEDIHELLWEYAKNEPGVYRFTGTYRVFKSARSRWNGSVVKVPLS